MGALYLAALVFGLGTLLLQLVMSGHGDADASHDLDAHPDAGHGDASHVAVATILSLRFWTFGLFGFGMVGALLWFVVQAPATLGLVLAVGMGLASGALASWLMGALPRSSHNSGAESKDALGRVGRVLVPVAAGSRGKVRLELKGQSIDFLASTDDAELPAGTTVVVVELRGEVLHVSRAPDELRAS